MAQSFIPRFQDPRVRTRCEQALGFVAACFPVEGSRSGAKLWLTRHFGQLQNPLSQWLKSNLLITVNDTYDHLSGRCKTYRRDTRGMEYVRACLEGVFAGTRLQWNQQRCRSQEPRDFHEPAVVWCRKAFLQELQSLKFDYQDKSQRLWHPLQLVKKGIKVPIQVDAGLRYHYDIESAALTLLLQHSQHQPLEISADGQYLRGPMDLWLWGIQHYLSHKDRCRQQWARDLEVTVTQIKEIITALVAGARISERSESAVFTMLGHDRARLQALREHAEIAQFRRDLRDMWDYLKWVMPRRRVETRRGPRWQAISSRDKWNLYFRLERSVLDQVRHYLRERQNPCFLEHDGWATRDPIDVIDLEKHIKITTGFCVRLDEKCF